MSVRALRLAAFFGQRGMQRGDRVAIMAVNNCAVLDVHFAAAAARTVVVNLNTHFVAPELAYVCQDSAPSMLVRGGDTLRRWDQR
jgi:acyl-CoA synthetase (AMP-forming)/AMP-acid ligase II